MKKIFALLAISLFTFSACSDDDNTPPAGGETHEAYIDATAKNTWTYFSFSKNAIVGTGAESEEDNAKWFARTDWDMAINRYMVRTNSGAATTAGAKGGIYVCDKNVAFNAVVKPNASDFKADTAVTSEGMGGVTTVVKSEAEVIVFKTNADGSLVMPPVYLKAPVCVVRSADGKKIYKVDFVKYLDEQGKSGHVHFNHAELL